MRVEWRKAAWAAEIALLTWAAFHAVGENGFLLLDDLQYLTQNSAIRGGLSWEGARWAFTTHYTDNWFPLTWLSFMLDISLFGLSPKVIHLGNLAYHTAAAVVLFFALCRITRQERQGEAMAAFLAACFAIHPLRVESVAWAVERKDVLSGLFGMLTLLAYLRYVERPSRARHGLVLLAFLAALLAKASVVSLPLALLALDLWPLRRFSRAAVLEKLPLLGLSALRIATTVFAVKQFDLVPLAAIPVTSRLLNAFTICAGYLRMIFFPFDLIPFYAFPLEGMTWGKLFAVALVLVISWSIWSRRERRPVLLAGWLWYLLALLPMLGFVQVGIHFMADRHPYFASLGVVLAVTYLGIELFDRLKLGRAPRAAVACMLLAGCILLTQRQVARWHDDLSLWNWTVSILPQDSYAAYLRGIAFAQARRQDEAIRELARSEQLNRPDRTHLAQYWSVFSLLPRARIDALTRRGGVEGARQGLSESTLREWVRVESELLNGNPRLPEVWATLAITLFVSENLTGAREALTKAFEMGYAPTNALDLELGVWLVKEKPDRETLDLMESLTRGYGQTGRFDGGAIAARITRDLAKTVDPSRVERLSALEKDFLSRSADPLREGGVVELNRGVASMLENKIDEAERHFHDALRVEQERAMPDPEVLRKGYEALVELARRRNDAGGASASAENALRVQSSETGDAASHLRLGLVLSFSGKAEEATEHLIKALALGHLPDDDSFFGVVERFAARRKAKEARALLEAMDRAYRSAGKLELAKRVEARRRALASPLSQ
jgi:tetratricopeptide (TPR) repeat protein